MDAEGGECHGPFSVEYGLMLGEGHNGGSTLVATPEERSGAFRRRFEPCRFEDDDQSQGLAVQDRGDSERLYKLPKGMSLSFSLSACADVACLVG